MNYWSAFGGVCSFSTLVIVLRVAFVAGIFKQRFVDVEKKVERLAGRADGHEAHLARHDLALTRINGRALHAAGK